VIDPRIEKQAKILVNYSTKVKKGEVVQIVGDELAKPLILAVYQEVLKKNPAEVKVHAGLEGLDEIYFGVASKNQIKRFPKLSFYEAKHTDVRIGIAAPGNTRHLSGINPDKLSLRAKVTQPIKDYIVEKVRWVITNCPTSALAQEADMSLGDFEDFLFRSINEVNWPRLAKKQAKLAKILTRGDKVRIVASGTDLTFSIKGRKAISACGEHNMPDGEVFTSVVENTPSGHIRFTYPAIFRGREVQEIELEFTKGKVSKAKAKKGEAFLKTMLQTDPGAKKIGEFGVCNNSAIDRFTKNILFDEKMGGTIHLALGRSYTETRGKNQSAIHWDMICDLRQGGEFYLDDRLMQKNGKWLV
jgi:aminopeptidase